VRATSGTIVHTATVPITVVDQLPATTLFGFSVLNHLVAGGTTVQSVTTLTTPAPTGGVTINLTSSNPAVATVPASVFVATSETGAFFNVTTKPVSVLTPVTISGSLNGETLSDSVTLTPPGGPDTLTPGKAEYVASKKQLAVQVTSTSTTLKVYDSGTGALIGTLTNGGSTTYKGQFNWPTFPSLVTIRSSLGGVTQMFVALK
jgi:hypothetical protein